MNNSEARGELEGTRCVDLQTRSVTVSVIVPSYGRPERLLQLLRTLLDQNVPAESYEVIVVDDGSPEPLCPVVRELIEGSAVRVRCRRKVNGGPASARDFGACEARGEYVLFVDDDMLVRQDFIAEHVRIQREFGPAAVTCEFDWEVEAEPKSLQRWCRRRLAEWRRIEQAALVPIRDGVFEYSNHSLTAANLSMAKSIYVNSGGFDAGYRSPGCEDRDFGVRLRKAGVRRILTKRTRATHIDTHDTLEKVCRRQEVTAMDTVRFMRRFCLLDQVIRPEISVVNGPVMIGTDPWSLVCKKVLKATVTVRMLSPLAFSLVRVLDWIAPESALVQRSYDLLVGAYVRQGWQNGLRVYDGVKPLKDVSLQDDPVS